MLYFFPFFAPLDIMISSLFEQVLKIMLETLVVNNQPVVRV